MRRLPWIVGCTLLSFGLVGCGDSPNLALRDTLTFYNELIDWINKVPDDDSAEEVAEEFSKNPALLFKYRAEALKDRWDKFSNPDKELKKDLLEAGKYWVDETSSVVGRFKAALDRLERIEDRLAEEEAKKERRPKRHAVVGIKKLMENDIAEYAARGEELVVIEKAKVCPKIELMKKKIGEVFSPVKGKGPAFGDKDQKK